MAVSLNSLATSSRFFGRMPAAAKAFSRYISLQLPVKEGIPSALIAIMIRSLFYPDFSFSGFIKT